MQKIEDSLVKDLCQLNSIRQCILLEKRQSKKKMSHCLKSILHNLNAVKDAKFITELTIRHGYTKAVGDICKYLVKNLDIDQSEDPSFTVSNYMEQSARFYEKHRIKRLAEVRYDLLKIKNLTELQLINYIRYVEYLEKHSKDIDLQESNKTDLLLVLHRKYDFIVDFKDVLEQTQKLNKLLVEVKGKKDDSKMPEILRMIDIFSCITGYNERYNLKLLCNTDSGWTLDLVLQYAENLKQLYEKFINLIQAVEDVLSNILNYANHHYRPLSYDPELYCAMLNSSIVLVDMIIDLDDRLYNQDHTVHTLGGILLDKSNRSAM